MNNVVSIKALSLAVVAGVALLASCSKSNDAPLSSTDSQTVNSESVSSSTSSEAADLGNSVISNVSDTKLASARVSGDVIGLGLRDRRLLGATITIHGTGTKTNPSGTITIDYGAGVTTDGVTRKGQITVAYSGRRLQPQSTRTITFSNFYRNAVQVQGTYTVTVTDSTLTSTDFTVTFSHVTAVTLTFADNTTIERNASFSAVWDYKISTPTQSTITHKLGGTAGGTTRKGKTYAMVITKDIVYRADCFPAGFGLPVSGTKAVSVIGGNTYTIDYGSDTCDNTVTITVNNKTHSVTVDPNGN